MGVSCIVLASGMSKRMNQNKLLMLINNKMIFEYILDTIKNIDFDEIIVVTRFKEIINYSKKLEYKVIINNNYTEGQASSIRLGIKEANEKNDYIFFVADQPKISKETILKIMEEYSGNKDEFIIPYFFNKKGNPVIFGNDYRKELLELEGDSGGSKIINKYREKIKRVDIYNYENKDIDSLADYEEMRQEYEK